MKTLHITAKCKCEVCGQEYPLPQLTWTESTVERGEEYLMCLSCQYENKFGCI